MLRVPKEEARIYQARGWKIKRTKHGYFLLGA